MDSFFTSHLVEIYFFYGLAFFITGVVVWLEVSRSPTLPPARTLPFLAAFGLVHGGHEWYEMFQLMSPDPPPGFAQGLRLFLLALSFVLLVEFGLRQLALDDGRRWGWARWVLLAAFLGGEGLVWVRWGADGDVWGAADACSRYTLAVPGALLAAAGLFRQSYRTARQEASVSRDLLVAGLAFALYGIPGQVFVGSSPLPPSTVVNSDLFLHTFHFPVQLLRSVMAGLIAIFIARALRVFELERRRRAIEINRACAEAQQQLNEELAQREALRRDLLHQTVQAQEEERRRIARELHDEAGQALTAISLRLAAAEEALPDRPQEARERIAQLRQLADRVMDDLRRLTTRLRPAVLDDLGLVAALITYADDCSSRFPFPVETHVTGRRRRLPPGVETTLYRIAQEAITNVAKHAQATGATVRLDFGEQDVTLTIDDDGVGMDVEVAGRAVAWGQGWGLAGIRERVDLVKGSVDIRSGRGAGTSLSVWVPILEEKDATDPVAARG